MGRLATLSVVVGLLAGQPAAAGPLDGCIALYEGGKPAAAAACFLPLATAGDGAARNWLSLLYTRGHGVGRDPAIAAAWERKATATAPPWSGCTQEIF